VEQQQVEVKVAKHDIKILEVVVVDGKPLVRGSVGEFQFEAAPKRWGSKMLMNVVADGLDRGQRVAIGHRAKAAIKSAGLLLPTAELVRPRKPKAEVVPEPVVEVTPDLVSQLDLVVAEDGFFDLTPVE
jgi:hypothetical protein